MKSMFAVAALVGLAFSSPALAGGYHHGWYGRGFYGGHCYPRYYGYHGGHFTSFSFGFGGYYAPAPVYVAPPPVVYYPPPPPVVVAPPVVVQPPVVAQPAAPAQPAPDTTEYAPQTAQPPPVQQGPSFVETGRRYHEHGDDAGKLDWVEGLIDGRPVKIYYDDFGRVSKQKWIDD